MSILQRRRAAEARHVQARSHMNGKASKMTNMLGVSAQVFLLSACGGEDESNLISNYQGNDTGDLPTVVGTENVALVAGLEKPLGDSFVSNSTVEGTDGLDVVSLNLKTATIRDGFLIDVETVNVVFNASATFDGTNAPALTKINLGLDGFSDPTDEVASTADVDLNEMRAEFTDLTIHASQELIEIDYQSGLDTDLSINFDNDSGDITVGGDGYQGAGHATIFFEAIEIIHADKVGLHHISTNTAEVVSFIDLFDDTSELQFTTQFEGGDLIVTDPDAAFSGGRAALVRTGAVQDIHVTARHGDLLLGAGDDFLHDAGALQTYIVSAYDAQVEVGTVGENGFADEFEILTFQASDTGTIEQGIIYAVGADIAHFGVAASDTNTVDGITTNKFVNVYIEGLTATSVGSQTLHAGDGGNIDLSAQNYAVDHQVFSGSGDITIYAGLGGYVQQQDADASDHSGDRMFVGLNGDDVFYGSSEDDTVTLTAMFGDDIYFDSEGSDLVTHATARGSGSLRIYDDGTSDLEDTGTATDDTYIVNGTVGTGDNANMKFYAGGGNDVIQLVTKGVLVDFTDYDSGVLYMGSFSPQVSPLVPSDKMSFDGMGEITTNSAQHQPGSIGTALNENSVYVFANGDVPLTGGVTTIADYIVLSDVANYLNEAFVPPSVGDAAVFVINNLSAGSGPGNALNFYVYYFEESGDQAGIQADDLSLIALSNSNAGPVTIADIV